jgi:3-dehydroquinate synthase
MSNLMSFSNRWHSASELKQGDNCYAVSTTLSREYKILLSGNIFLEDSDLLETVVDTDSAMVIYTPTVNALYGEAIRRKFSQLKGGERVSFFELAVTERNKEIEMSLEVCRLAKEINFPRNGQIIAVGGGVCLDVVGFAASIYRRGVKCIKVPTTFIGMIDAAVGIKNGINYEGKKSVLGSFYPAEYTFVCPGFLNTLAVEHLKAGFAEAIKIAIIKDATLFGKLVNVSTHMNEEKLQSAIGWEVVDRSVVGMLTELSENLYELDSYQRYVDFGHTFSPHIESATNYKVSHGEAVAIDIALSAVISAQRNLLAWDTCQVIIDTLKSAGLSVTVPAEVETVALYESLAAIVAHRAGALNLVIPVTIGTVAYIEHWCELSCGQLQQAVTYLESHDD